MFEKGLRHLISFNQKNKHQQTKKHYGYLSWAKCIKEQTDFEPYILHKNIILCRLRQTVEAVKDCQLTSHFKARFQLIPGACLE